MSNFWGTFQSQIQTEAEIINTADVKDILFYMDTKRSISTEETNNKTIINKIINDSDTTDSNINKITNFVTYGTASTNDLGSGERAGVVNSYKSAYGEFPSSTDDWSDVLKIANGRWPSKKNKAAEDRAGINFKTVYKREPDRENPNDDAAITVMAYGLRPVDRNLDSEKTSIKFFKDIYKYNPVEATDWDVVRAIAYSGATR